MSEKKVVEIEDLVKEWIIFVLMESLKKKNKTIERANI